MSSTLYKTNHPVLGILPKSKTGRIAFAWAFLNILLTVAPIYTNIGNSPEIFAGILPVTILYSYIVFLSNCMMGLFFFQKRALPWAKNQQ